MRRIIAFVVWNLLSLAVCRYVDIGDLCLDSDSKDEKYKSTQVMISYNATPYPFVTNDTNITFTCSGQTVHLDSVSSDDKSYMKNIEFYKNGQEALHDCQRDERLKLRSLSCNISVSGVTHGDYFWCIVRASNAPCNAGQISFQIKSNTAPNVSRLIPSFKDNTEVMEVTCVGAGIPEPRVTWLLNGSLISHTKRENMINAKVDSWLADIENGTNVYHTISKIVITGKTFPLSIHCVVENDVGKAYSNNVYTLYFKVMVLKLRTVAIEWVGHPNMNSSLHFVYNVSLKCGGNCIDTTGLYNKSSVTFTDLSMRRAYKIKVQALSKTDDLIVGAANFYSPDKLPKPNRIYIKKVTSYNAVVGWKNISANLSVHGVLVGYKIVIIGKNKKIMDITLSNNKNELVLSDLARKSEYTVSVRGFTQYGNGSVLEFNFTTLDTIPAPKNVKISSVMENSAVIQWEVIENEQEKYDVIMGYKVAVKNTTHSFDLRTSKDSSSFTINDLLPNRSYNVSVVGLGEETEGMPSEWIGFRTSEQMSLPNNDGNTETTKRQSSSNLTIVVVPVAIIMGALIVVVFLAVLRVRRRKAKKFEASKPNQMQVEVVARTFDNNLRILFPEYYDNDVSDSVEDLPSWEINRACLAVLDNVLGGGHFGFVREGVLMESLSSDQEIQRTTVAVKTLKVNRGQSDWNELLREFDVLKHVNSTGHRNIIKLIGGCTQEAPVLLLMEFCSGGNLKDLLRDSRINEEYKNVYSKLTERQLINFAAEISAGMKFLFEKKVVHRDIACRNILLTDELVPKIADFGLARKIDVTAHYIVNKNRLLPVKWMSMESLAEGRFTTASDTWSYGVLLWEICTLADEPYPEVSPYDILEYLLDGNRMSRPNNCSIEIFSIMENCWQEDPKERPSFNDIYNSLENMLSQNERTYINMRPLHDVNETMTSEPESRLPDVSENSKVWDLSDVGENSSNDSGVYETCF